MITILIVAAMFGLVSFIRALTDCNSLDNSREFKTVWNSRVGDCVFSAMFTLACVIYLLSQVG